MTTDLQRLHQDEWLSALRSGEYVQCGGGRRSDREMCALHVAMDVLGLSGHDCHYVIALPDLLGISSGMLQVIYARNDGWRSPNMNPTPGVKWSYDEIADWFKAERDAHAGDLSGWTAP